MPNDALCHTVATTALGDLTVARAGDVVTGLYFTAHRHPPARAALGPRVDTGFERVLGELEEYLAGERRAFTVPAAARGGDPFQRRVWELLTEIPYGRTTTYGAIAARLGDGATARQVGGAVGRNPVSILIPCHRVIGADGNLTGYAGGLEIKRRLLEIEGAETASGQQALMLGA
jgi:methylated-DNA-[protein]-cysteine S-methyltransferase